MFDVSSGPKLKALRQRMGLTQANLASFLGKSQAYIGQLEAKALISAKLQARIREVLHIHNRGEHAPELSELDAAYDRVVEALTVYHNTAVQYARVKVPEPLMTLDETPAGRAYVPQTGEEKARKRFEAEQEYKRLKAATLRNSQRERDRATIAELHAQLKPLAAAQDWDAYRRAIGQAHTRAGEDQPFMDAYCSAALARVIADEDPLVTLPLETID